MPGAPGHTEDLSSASALQHAIETFFAQSHSENGKTVPPHDLIVQRSEIIGTGSFSKVRLVEVRLLKEFLEKQGLELDEFADVPAASSYFAMKAQKKTEVVRLKHTDHVKSESKLLASVSHPFIVTLFHRFQDDKNLYLVEEFVQCGQLMSYIQNNRRLTNEVARFYAAQIVMGVQALHGQNVIYRDLNPENIVLDRQLYIKLVDFGFAKTLNLDDPTARTWTLVGEPEYLAPEIVTSAGHSKEVDWWALGIIIHEMLAGFPPFYDRDEFMIYKMITNANIQTSDLPKHFESDGKEIIKKLLAKQRDTGPSRLGSGKSGAEEIKKHKWFRGLNWAALYNKHLKAPTADRYPIVDSLLDVHNFGHHNHSMEEQGPLLDQEKQELFQGFETAKLSSNLT